MRHRFSLPRRGSGGTRLGARLFARDEASLVLDTLPAPFFLLHLACLCTLFGFVRQSGHVLPPGVVQDGGGFRGSRGKYAEQAHRHRSSTRFAALPPCRHVTMHGGVYWGCVAFHKFRMNWHGVGLVLSLGFRRCARAHAHTRVCMYVCNNGGNRHVLSGDYRGREEILKKKSVVSVFITVKP